MTLKNIGYTLKGKNPFIRVQGENTMSRELGMNCINCRQTPRPAHTEYSMEYHTALIGKIAGVPEEKIDRADPGIRRRLYDAFDYDFLFGTHDGFVDWTKTGRTTDMGHAVYASDGSDQRVQHTSPFKDTEEVWAFDPIAEYGVTPFDELVAGYEKDYRKRCEDFPGQVCTGGYYKTVISGAIASFGWDMLLQSASDRQKFARVLEGFGAYTMHHVRAWAKTSIEVFIQHDDMVWTSGPFIQPEVYRETIFPIFRELWKPLKAAGKKVLFCSDGTFDMFVEDLAECGADGFIFEPSNNFDSIVEKVGGTHCIIGSKVDCRTMTFGTWEDVKKEIDATLAATRSMNGFMFAVGNHIPANISDEMCEKYIDYLRANWSRG